MKKIKKGDICYASGSTWEKVEIIKVISSGYYHVKNVQTGGLFGVSGHRLLSEEEYESIKKIEAKNRIISAPPLH